MTSVSESPDGSKVKGQGHCPCHQADLTCVTSTHIFIHQSALGGWYSQHYVGIFTCAGPFLGTHFRLARPGSQGLLYFVQTSCVVTWWLKHSPFVKYPLDKLLTTHKMTDHYLDHQMGGECGEPCCATPEVWCRSPWPACWRWLPPRSALCCLSRSTGEHTPSSHRHFQGWIWQLSNPGSWEINQWKSVDIN